MKEFVKGIEDFSVAFCIFFTFETSKKRNYLSGGPALINEALAHLAEAQYK